MAQEKKTDTNKKYQVRDLEPLLQKTFGDTLKVLNYSVDSLVTFGENFSGTLLKINTKVQRTVDSQIEDLHFVAKTIIGDEIFMNWTVLVKKEAFMYTNIIPFYASVELENNIPVKTTIEHFFPNFYGYRLSLDSKKDEVDEDAVILLENLKYHGYYVLDKIDGLDFEHASETMKVLAKFHALGVAVKIKYPVEFDRLKDEADISGYTQYFNQFANICKNLISALKDTPSFNKYIGRVEKILEMKKKEEFKFDKARHDLWSTIVHYDFWTNNILFHKNDSGKIDGVKIIDFQAYAFADLFVDLYYFLCTSLNDDAKLNHISDLLDIYYQSFISTLESVHVDVSSYSKQKFDDRLKEIAWFELYHCIMALSFFTCKDDNNDREALIVKIFTFQGGDLFQRKLTDLLRIYDQMGWLE